ncbi:MAG TPA: ACT domain-containing protein [Dehalococcoidia bacterium]|nr:ACT domain-containing protein [Dehalococcoidia bacterium]
MTVLKGEPARNTVNAPFVAPEVHAVLEPYIRVALVVGKLVTHLAEGQFLGVTIGYQGEITEHDTATLKAAVLAGVLSPVTTGQVNLINSSGLAQERGLNVTEQRNAVAQEYSSLISATLETTEGSISITGTSMRNEPHIVRFNEYWMDIIPTVPYLLFVDNQDQPGSIGAVGTLAGRHNINISFMEVGRLNLRGRAMMVLGLDDPVPPNVMHEINALPHIYNARLVKL